MGEQEYRQMFGKSREEAVAETKKELQQALKNKDKDKAKTLQHRLRKVFVGDDVLWANEVSANITVSAVMFVLCVILILTLVLSKAGIYKFKAESLVPMFSLCIAQMLAGIILNAVFRAERRWLKYVLNLLVCCTIAVVTCMMGFRAAIAFTIPTVLSVRYFSERFTRLIAVVSGVFVLTSTVGSAYLAVSPDLHVLPVPEGTVVTVTTTLTNALSSVEVDHAEYMKRLLLESYLPNLFQFLVVAVLCVKVAKWGHRMVTEQAEVAEEFTRVDTELKMATDIQANVLPNIFPPFPTKSEIDIYATMHPAKEVGGDFYDFFLIDENHLGIVVADVSGKGVPAALFMMIGKALIKNQAQMSMKPAEVFMTVNNQLCENNASDMFITAWFGVLDIRTGLVTACSAGHEHPAVGRKNGEFELLNDPHGFVLAGMENIRYRDYQIQLTPGDMLYVYTDGVTEATNTDEQLFGEERLLKALNQYRCDSPEQLLKDVRRSIDAFVGSAPQFDDITMVALRYLGPKHAYPQPDKQYPQPDKQ